MTNLFFISSPLHFLIACSLASEHKEDKNIAILISKNAESAHSFKKAIEDGLTDFTSALLLLEKNKGSKLSSRRMLFREIERLVEREKPSAVYTGNDRRVEFQYAMHAASKLNSSVEGIYMDDGAISYLGHKSISSVFHKHIDPTLKKFVYGKWWKNALTTGASDWISSGYLAFPDLAHPLLQAKELKPLNPDIFSSKQFAEIGQSLLEGKLNTSIPLSNIKVLLCLPVDDEFETCSTQFANAFKGYLAKFNENEIAIKAHPRSELDVVIQSTFEGAVVMPKRVGLEALLPLLNSDIQIIGSASTSLLTARWLRPDINVFSLTQSKNQMLSQLLNALEIQYLN